MPEPSPTEFLADPLSDISRRERRNLLFTSVTGILIAKTGLVPNRISALGVEFSAPAQDALVVLMAAVVLYFVFAFVIYGASDFLVWRKRYQDYLVAVEMSSQSWTQEDQQRHDELHKHIPRIDWLYNWSKPTALVRILFEFLLPIIIGIVSTCFLFLLALSP